jgi:tRNA modification GTPase
MNFLNQEDTICALSTAGGMGAIALIRLSGKNAIEIVEKVFSKTLADKNSHTVHFGQIRRDQVILDEVVVTIFRNPSAHSQAKISWRLLVTVRFIFNRNYWLYYLKKEHV